MVIVFPLAIVIGGLLVSVVSFIPFVATLFMIIVLGFASAVIAGMPMGHALIWCAAVFTCTQVGYGLGVGLIAYVQNMRPTAKKRPMPSISKPH